MSYHHLTCTKRSQIELLSSMGLSQKEIALRIDVHPSTISREMNRNSIDGRYCYKKAEEFARKRSTEGRKRIYKWTLDLEARVAAAIKKKWSPDQISGRLSVEGVSISHERIYRFIHSDRAKGGKLYLHLRHRGKRYKYKRSSGRGLLKNRIDISQRPSVVEEKSRIGDFEVDTIVGAQHKGALVSIVDRHSKFTLLRKVETKDALSVSHAITAALKALGKNITKTITCDNGKEFAMHQIIAKQLKAGIYFAPPYQSWRRGLNEHTNGLVRQYIPKGMSISPIPLDAVQNIANALNSRPRKVLGYRTPHEVFYSITALE